jgi:hypothetical protein
VGQMNSPPRRLRIECLESHGREFDSIAGLRDVLSLLKDEIEIVDANSHLQICDISCCPNQVERVPRLMVELGFHLERFDRVLRTPGNPQNQAAPTMRVWFTPSSVSERRLVFEGTVLPNLSRRKTLRKLVREVQPHVLNLVSRFGRDLDLPEVRRDADAQPLTSESDPLSNVSVRIRGGLVTLKRALRRLVRGRPRAWSVGFTESQWPATNPEEIRRLEPPKGRYFADPFLIRRDDRLVCVVEEAGLNGSSGKIAAIEMRPDGRHAYLGEILDEPFHLSFPFPFTIHGHLYLMPESAEDGTIRIYECVGFPTEWRLCHLLAEGVEAYDSMMFPDGDNWRLLTTLTPPGSTDKVSRLYEATVEDPLKSRIREDDFELVFCSPRGGRNAGFIEDARATIRASQIQTADTYGAGLILEESGYFGHGKVIWGSHHIHSTQAGTVMDFLEQ